MVPVSTETLNALRTCAMICCSPSTMESSEQTTENRWLTTSPSVAEYRCGSISAASTPRLVEMNERISCQATSRSSACT